MTNHGNIFLFFFLSFICIIFVMTIPIFEMYIGINFTNDIICRTSTLGITLPIWLIVKSSISFCILLSVFLYIITSANTIYSFCIYYILYTTYIFSIFWVIIGTIIFFKDCNNLTPYFNTFMWVDLILSYMSIFNNFILCRE